MQKIVNAVNQPTNTALDSVIAKASPNIAQVLLLGGCATSIELEAGACSLRKQVPLSWSLP
ncbi:hypothetical protein [Moraxella lacunata]|uniref:hypothetical protein n=2 Tax=Moraxella TaxID=475 RepID=UPI003EE1FF70